METGTAVERFEASAAEHDVTVSKTESNGFADSLHDAIDPPAIGVPLPIDGISLEESEVELELTPGLLETARTGVTPVSFGIASLGTVFVPSDEQGSEPVSLFPERHVAVIRDSDILTDLKAGFERLQGTFAGGSTTGIFATGPSATADMGARVQGVHGPKEVHVIVVSDR